MLYQNIVRLSGVKKMNEEIKTRKETYDFYDWMKKPEHKSYLDSLPLEVIHLSLRSNGTNPKSVCLFGNPIDCGCNTCRMNRDIRKNIKIGERK